jgi:hypothetical protein
LLCALEQVRALFDAPIIVSSGYRSARSTAGSAVLHSQHVQGLAADFTVVEVSPRDRAADQRKWRALRSTHPEFDKWVHLSVTRDTPRRQVLTYAKGAATWRGCNEAH